MPTPARPRGWSYKPGSTFIRGYDTSVLFREDCLERIQWLYDEIGAIPKRIAKIAKEVAEGKVRIQKGEKVALERLNTSESPER